MQLALRHQRVINRRSAAIVNTYATEVRCNCTLQIWKGPHARVLHLLIMREEQNACFVVQAPMSTQSKPVYANFAIYKGKAALSLRVSSVAVLSYVAEECDAVLYCHACIFADSCMEIIHIHQSLQVRKPRWTEMQDGAYMIDRSADCPVMLCIFCDIHSAQPQSPTSARTSCA